MKNSNHVPVKVDELVQLKKRCHPALDAGSILRRVSADKMHVCAADAARWIPHQVRDDSHLLENDRHIFLKFMPVILSIMMGIMFAAFPAAAQSINLNVGGQEGGSTASQIIQLVMLITVLSLAPSILMMVTSFVRIVVSLSLLRTALGLQQTPPNTVIISLAMFLTFFIMAPTFNKAYEQGVKPLMAEKIKEEEAVKLTAQPFHDFMMHYVRDKDLKLFADIAKMPATTKVEEVPYQILVPAFMISELRRSFEIGFLLFLPFLIIDMVVSSILMAMGMMMLPPSVVALPFKIIFFVLVDGWYLVVGSLVKSYGIS